MKIEIQNLCSQCGRNASNWTGDGFYLSGKNYCCEGCAQAMGCQCPSQPLTVSLDLRDRRLRHLEWPSTAERRWAVRSGFVKF